MAPCPPTPPDVRAGIARSIPVGPKRVRLVTSLKGLTKPTSPSAAAAADGPLAAASMDAPLRVTVASRAFPAPIAAPTDAPRATTAVPVAPFRARPFTTVSPDAPKARKPLPQRLPVPARRTAARLAPRVGSRRWLGAVEDAATHPSRPAIGSLVDAIGLATRGETTNLAAAAEVGLPRGAVGEGAMFAEVAASGQTQDDAVAPAAPRPTTNPAAASAMGAPTGAVSPRLRRQRLIAAAAGPLIDAVRGAGRIAAVEAAATPKTRAPPCAFVTNGRPTGEGLVPRVAECHAMLPSSAPAASDLTSAVAAVTPLSAVAEGKRVTRPLPAPRFATDDTTIVAKQDAPPNLAAAAPVRPATSGDSAERSASRVRDSKTSPLIGEGLSTKSRKKAPRQDKS